MSQTGVSYPGKGISYTPDPAYPINNPLKFRVAQVIQVSMISMIKPNGSNSILVIHGINGEISTSAEALWASGTAASYALQSGQHVLLTDATTSNTFYLNADLFKGVSNVPGGVNSLLQYGTEGAQFKSITVVGTATTIQAAFDATANAAKANATTVSAAGVDQGTATVVTGSSPLFITVTGGAGGILLPAATLGSFIYVDSQIGTDLNVYPAVGEYINGGAVNVPYVLQAQGNASFICNIAGQWAQSENSFPVVHTNEIQSIGTTLRIVASGGVTTPDVVRVTTEDSGFRYGGAGILTFNVNGLDVADMFSVAGGKFLFPRQYLGLNNDVLTAIAAPGAAVATQRITIDVCAVATHGIQLPNFSSGVEFTIYADPGCAFPPTVYDDAGVIIGTVIPAGDIATVTPFNGGWKMRIETPV